MPYRGLVDPKKPHVSFTQIMMFTMCEMLWKFVYILGKPRPPTGPMIDGGATDRILKEITNRVKNQPDGIDAHEVEEIIERHAHRFATFNWFSQVVKGVRAYAIEANESKEYIFKSPFKFRTYLSVDGRKIQLWGEVDRLDVNPNQAEFWVREFKLRGAFMDQTDLEEDLQTSIYNLSVRQVKKELKLAVGWKNWYSVVRGFWTNAKADVDDAEATKYFLIGRIRKMIKAIKTGIFKATTNRNCWQCPGAKTCKTWHDELHGISAERIASPTLGVFARLRERATGVNTAKDKFKDLIIERVDMNNGILIEDGWAAKLNHTAPHLKEEYKAMTREQLLEILVTSGSTRLSMKPAKIQIPGEKRK